MSGCLVRLVHRSGSHFPWQPDFSSIPMLSDSQDESAFFSLAKFTTIRTLLAQLWSWWIGGNQIFFIFVYHCVFPEVKNVYGFSDIFFLILFNYLLEYISTFDPLGRLQTFISERCHGQKWPLISTYQKTSTDTNRKCKTQNSSRRLSRSLVLQW